MSLEHLWVSILLQPLVEAMHIQARNVFPSKRHHPIPAMHNHLIRPCRAHNPAFNWKSTDIRDTPHPLFVVFWGCRLIFPSTRKRIKTDGTWCEIARWDYLLCRKILFVAQAWVNNSVGPVIWVWTRGRAFDSTRATIFWLILERPSHFACEPTKLIPVQ